MNRTDAMAGESDTVRRRAMRARALQRGLTLFEVIVAVTLIVLLLGSFLTFFWQVLEVRDVAQYRSDRLQRARAVIDRLAQELRGCVGIEQLGFPVAQRLQGTRWSVTFLSVGMPDRERYQFYEDTDVLPPAQHDLRSVTYALWVAPDTTDEFGNPAVGGILRTEQRTLNQFMIDEEDTQQVRTDLWSHELGYLEFRYFDGVEWTTEWTVTEGNSLPQAVQITVGYLPITMDEYENLDLEQYRLDEYPLGDDREHPDRYSVIVRLPAADKFFGSRVQRVGQGMVEQLGVGGLP